ncbi:alpha/beta hydrolase [Actinomadura rubrisoli]|nr:alpha/beta fold hydrolase [Actinomadura rubrisoli]
MWKRTTAGVAAALAALTMLCAPAAADSEARCTTVQIPVTLQPGRPPQHVVSGTLCTPAAYTDGVRRVDVLVHGGTYNSDYWQWPQNPGLYSYARKTTDAGRASFAYDRPGSGASTRPPSAALTIAADAHVLHQVIQWLGTRNFAQTTVVGHSLGSIIAIAEAAGYDDVDRLVLTGALHPPALAPGALLTIASFSPAILDPKFAGRPIDLGYLTTLPGTRAASFYRTPTADPAVISRDEAEKDTMSGVELSDSAVRVAVPPGLNDANRVRADVLAIVGQHDAAVCGMLLNCGRDANVRANEAPYFTSAASLTGAAVPRTGHVLALHPSADLSFARINQWINAH